MATVMNSPRAHSVSSVNRSSVQKICFGMGILFILIGFVGVVAPGLMGMHLSLTHNLIHLASGALSIWAATGDEQRAYNFSVSFGIFYGLLGLAGFVFGSPGYPSVGHTEADQNLLRLVPNVLELGSMDHSIHLLISAIFLFAAYWWKHDERNAVRGVVSTQVREREATNFQRGLADSELGTNDINRVSDVERRAEFESKL